VVTHPSGSAGYQAELRRIDQDIAGLGGAEALSPPIEPQRVTRYLFLLYQRASIAGDFAGLGTVVRTIERTVPRLAHPGDLYLLKANAACKLHRLADAEAALLALPSLCQCSEGRLILADLAFQRGQYREAESGYHAALETAPSWSALARVAYFQAKMGDTDRADHLYREAEDELTAKEMRSYAWLEVQRGFLAFSHGCYSAARSHYDRAEAAYPGYWLVHEYLAELLGAEGRFEQALTILEGIASSNFRPDLQQAIGELLAISNQPDAAGKWYEKALAGYLQSVRRGEVHFLHHLADYCADVAKNGTEAVRWARADLQLRQNFSTQAALAWALYRNGQFDEARAWIDRALASEAVEAHLYFRAAVIYAVSGNPRPERSHMDTAMRLNPGVENFHLHH
jgi:tetratricopeptide (TPR) repeat protein